MMISREQTRQNYDRLSRQYDLFAVSETQFTESGLQVLAVKTGERLLGIGFGTETSLVALARQVGTSGLAAAVELSPGIIVAARKRYNEDYPTLIYIFKKRTKVALMWTAFGLSLLIIFLTPWIDKRVAAALFKFAGFQNLL